MRKQIFKMTQYLSMAVIMLALVGSMFGYDLLGLIVGVGGFQIATTGAIIAGEASSVENVESAQEGIHLDDIDKVVTKMWPAYAPLDQLLRTGMKAQRRKTNSIKTRHYAVEVMPFSDVVTSAITAANQSYFDLPVGNPDLYGVGDTLFVNGVPGIKEGTAATAMANADLELCVESIDRSSKILKVIPVNGDSVTTTNKSLLKTGVQDIALNAEISIGGRALSEFKVQTDPSQYVPEDDYNYCQYFASQIEISKWEQIHEKEVNFDEADQLELALYTYRARREVSYWKGTRAIKYPNGEKTYFCGGIAQFVDNQIDWTSKLADGKPNIKAGDLDEMVRKAFSGNSGSGQRWMFVGEFLWNALKRTEDIQKNLSAKDVEYKFGLYFNKINTGDGELVLIKHPLFYSMGWGYDAVIIDANNIGERHFVSNKVESIDKRKLAQSNSDAKFISEVSCPVVKYPATHHFIKGPKYTSLT